jgi:hypothetical protein
VNPIVVDKQMRVIDGQHRLAAAQILGAEIFYIQEDIERSDISLLNSNQKNWTAMDYINYYTVEKNPAFLQLSQLINKYENMAISALLVLASSEGKRCPGELKEGILDVLHINHAREVSELCYDLNHRFQKDFVFDSRFPLALGKAMDSENFKIERLIEQIQAAPREFVPCHTKKQYCSLIEEIYNRNLSKNKINLD